MRHILRASVAAAGFAFVAGCGGGDNGTTLPVIGMWTTTSVSGGGTNYTQMDRLARPVVNEVFATVANNRHKTNDEIAPTQDRNELANDIQGFMTGTAGRSQATTDVVKSVLVPDVMKADLNMPGEAAYLGLETGGATSGTGSKFGGRKL